MSGSADSGAYRTQRRAILDYVFNERVPKVQSQEYMDEWGEPQSVKRLGKMANSLAAFCRHAKRRKSGDFEHAIAEWEEDLKYLKDAYYAKTSGFKWPE
jgi:hypothetical protein